ncbi:hypothetical protein [Bacteroides uniformis]|uniref:hypothetical protein n=1 Tax=Bacteroides uniformis TaxID=820 RepID=UPI0039B5564D
MKDLISYYSTDSTIWILYSSPVSWNYTIMAQISLVNDEVHIFKGDNHKSRHKISELINNDKASRKLAQIGCDSSIIKSAVDVLDKVNECESIYYDVLNLKNHIRSENLLFDAQINHELGRSLNKNEIVSLIEAYRNIYCGSASKDRCYAGITGDLDIRMVQHQNDERNKPQGIGIGILCCTTKMAIDVELELHKRGYCGGTNNIGNGAGDNSCIVYIYKAAE